jgi:hypothetical protein
MWAGWVGGFELATEIVNRSGFNGTGIGSRVVDRFGNPRIHRGNAVGVKRFSRRANVFNFARWRMLGSC